MRREALEGLLLPQGLAHEPEVHQLQVAQPAVDQLGRLGGGARREVILLEERHRGAAQGQVPRYAAPAMPPPTTTASTAAPSRPISRLIRSSRLNVEVVGQTVVVSSPFGLIALNARSAPRPILSRDQERARR